MTVIFKRPSSSSGIESMTAIDHQAQWSILHHHFEIVMVHRGRVEAYCRRRYLDVESNTMNVMQPGDFHRTVRQHVAGTFQVLLLEPAYVLDLMPEVQDISRLNFKTAVHRVDSRIRRLCRHVHALIAQDCDPVALQEGVAQLLRTAVEIAGEPAIRAKAVHLGDRDRLSRGS